MKRKPGRRERPLDPQGGPVEQFALELRALREKTGLTYTQMAVSASFSSSTLSQAAAGHRLPTRDVVAAYVRACGGDAREWEERWERAHSKLHGPVPQGSIEHVTAQNFISVETTSFVGRESELAAGAELIGRGRLVTLVGIGGVGKTRLARRLVQAVASRFPDGTYCTELADLRSGEGIAQSITSAVGAQVGAGQDPLHTLAEVLRGRSVLLLLDNCEHLLHACARLTNNLLTLAPGLRILATSRQPFDISAEHVLRVSPLSLPAPNDAGLDDGSQRETAGTTTSTEESIDGYIHSSSAVALFVDRAKAASPGFQLASANQVAVARVCHRLDGLPFALELAARRLRALTLDELLERLDDRFRVLGPRGGDRTAHPRHQTLRTLFDWSYELCTEAERRAWQQLSLCAGGVLLTDAERLCGPAADDPTATAPDDVFDAFDALAGLVDQSLLTVSAADGQTRLHMLETVRAYGQERLAGSGRMPLALRRHRAWYLGLAAQAGNAYGTSDEAVWLRRLRREHANLRQILTAPPPADEPAETVLRASLGFWLHCLTSATVGEGTQWMHSILERHPQPPTPESAPDWCRAAWVAAFLLLLHGNHESAHEIIRRAEQFLPGPSSPPSATDASAQQALGAELMAAFLQLRGLAALLIGDTEAADTYSESALVVGRWSASLLTEPQSIAQRGFAAVLHGDRAGSTPFLEEALALSEARGDSWHRCYLLWALAVDHGEAGRTEIAQQLLRRALQHVRDIDEHMGEAAISETLAWLLSSGKDPRSAATVLGAVDHVWAPSGIPRLFGFALLSAHRDRALHNARHALGDHAFAAAYREGGRIGLRVALAQACEESR
ncbi:ATP-binding protein [Streptomyces sp. NPDC003393]